MLFALLTAVDVNVVESPRSTSDFSLTTTPRSPPTAEPTPRPDNGMHAKSHTAKQQSPALGIYFSCRCRRELGIPVYSGNFS